MKFAKEVTTERVRELLNYDAATGVFTWAEGRPGASAGSRAGHTCRRHGYVMIRIDRRLHRAHRLAWLHIHGRWPAVLIDHIDGDKANNALSNLREASHCENNRNIAGRSGVKVRHDRPNSKYRARIVVDGKDIYLGSFKTPEAAHEAYLSATQRHFGEFSPVNRIRVFKKA